jgi:hypothetical protein
MQLSRPALALMIAAAMTSSAVAANPAMKSMAETTNLKITMHSQNGSKEDGTATLMQKGKNVVVTIDLTNAPKAAQPAHIHPGTCAKLNPSPKYPLSNVVNGKSTTTIDNVDLDKLISGRFAINVHKSTTDLKTYVSCGDIKK